jgi:SAM-dependent methyltransferase
LSRERAKARLSAIALRSRLLSSLLYARAQARYRLGLRPHGSGATAARLGCDSSVEYARRCADDYLRYAGVEEGFLDGRRVLELGPGDSVATAICLLARGAARVVSVEAFDPVMDERRNAGLYRTLLDSFPEAARARAERGLRLGIDGTIELDPDRLLLLRGTRIEDAARALGGERFDVVLSRAVLEHVDEVDRAWDAMVDLLDPPGAMWHKVDLRHHGYFAHLHPCHFLTVSDRPWRWMSSPDPTLNRCRVDTYRGLAAASFEQVRLLITHVLDGDEIQPHVDRVERGVHYGDRELALIDSIRPRLAPRFRAISQEDLLVGGIFLIASGLRREREPGRAR